MPLDDLDRALLRLAVEEPRAGLREYARVLGVARGTVQSRMARLQRGGAIASYAATVSPRALGFPIEAFIHLYLSQGKLDQVTAGLTRIPEVLQAHTTTGEGDVLCRIAARDNEHLEQTVQALLSLTGVVRTKTEIAMRECIAARVLPLLTLCGDESSR
jgi:DNA-binding Lrp family transcriptional regulator